MSSYWHTRKKKEDLFHAVTPEANSTGATDGNIFIVFFCLIQNHQNRKISPLTSETRAGRVKRQRGGDRMMEMRFCHV